MAARGRAALLSLALAASSLVGIVGSAAPAAAAAPTPTPARTGVPANIYAIGDSITTATGTGNLGAEQKQNSWVTGTTASVSSMRARLGIGSANAVNLASNGRRMQDFDDQANQLPSTAQYVVVELGGNDLCRDTVADMTSVADYRTQFRNGLAAVAAHAPNALIYVASVPDIYNLWYIRGAPSSFNPYVADQTGQDGYAHTYWDTLGVIPCKSLLDNPTSMGADETRRQQVRTRNLAFNQVLAEECNAVLRCRFDGNNLFDKSSNRVSPPNGSFLPRNQWWFEDYDISYNDGFWSFLCPAPGTLEGGTICGDMFHPSLRGQSKLAQAGHESSYQFLTDSSAPTVTTSVSRPPDGNGVYGGSVEVGFGGSDASGIRGQEVRVHQPNGTVGPWQQSIGLAPPLTVSAIGTSYVEARSLDANGNLSASTIRAITVDPTQFGDLTGTVTDDLGPVAGVEVAVSRSGVPAGSTTTGSDGTYRFDDLPIGAYDLAAHDPTGEHLDGATAASLVAAGTTADLRLTRTPGAVAGTVADADGPLEGVEVALRAAGSDPVLASTTTAADGTYSFPLVLPGAYDVAFHDPSGDHGDTTVDGVTVTRTQTATADAVLGLVPGTITGTVADPDGAPVAGIAVGTGPLSDTTAADGTFSLGPAAPGPHTVSTTAVPCAWLAASAPADVPRGGGSDDVTLTVQAEPPGPHGLADVPAWLEDAVRWIVDACNVPPYLEPRPNGRFAPNVAITRGDVVQALYRIAGSPPQAPGGHGLTDVPAALDAAVTWAVTNQHMTGYRNRTFRPGASITRAEIARVLYRLAGSPPQSPRGHGMSDVPAWVDAAVTWLVGEGHATGYPNGTFRPSLAITRGQFARMAFRIYS